MEFPKAVKSRKLQAFLGPVNFYHRFINIPNHARILQPLYRLLHVTKNDKTKLCWTNEATLAFEARQALANATLLLLYPKLDALTSIMCDASDTAVGAVLPQGNEGQWCPIE